MNDALDPSEEQFFQQGEETPSLAPEEPPEAPEPSEVPNYVDSAAAARRARLRRYVGLALLGSAGLFGIGLVRHFGGSLLELGASKPARQATLSAQLPAPVTVVAALSPASAASSELAEPPPPSAPPVSDIAPALDAAALIRSARTLLEGGHLRDGIAAARSAVNANPRNAEPYILLAAGLQDLGKWAEAQTVFATCREATSSGPNATCRYFAGAGAGK